ncbi:MAG TPA: hypothetical protein PKZ43_04035 [Bacteroidales bacterium]|nr:hypothetical protein [Bacteroidales bacterium]
MLFFNLCFSQNIKIIVIDSVTNLPIPFSNVIFDNMSGTYTNNQGVFFTNKTTGNLRIANIAYLSKNIKTPLNDTIVKLKPAIFQLNEIVIKPNNKTLFLGFYKYKTEFTYSGLSGDEIAVLIPYNKNYISQIQDVLIEFDNRKIVKKDLDVNFTCVFKLNFYSVKENSLEPDL